MSEEESEYAVTESEASISEESESSDPDSDESDSNRKKKRKYSKTKTFTYEAAENQYRCNNCPKTFASMGGAYKHTRSCKFRKKQDAVAKIKCDWCNLEFKNKGNLATHAYHLHGDSSYKAVVEQDKIYECDVCQSKLQSSLLLKYHIRKMHFNLKAKRPYAEMKKVNQVWFEKVLNSNNIMEIKKTAQNKLVMRKLDEGTAIKVKDMDTEVIDLTHIYPTEYKSATVAKVKVTCDICKGSYNKKDLSKHKKEVHMNFKKHHCNNCNRSFKRSYQFLQHVCNKQRRMRGVKKHRDSTIIISGVESLSLPWAT